MLRRATALDIPTVVGLRTAVFASMGFAVDPQGPRGELAARWFAAHLGGDACAFIAYEGEEAVAIALGYLQIAPPSPSTTAGVRGYVSDVMTLPAHRRRGHARRCVRAVTDWFSEETPAEVVDLVTNEDGLALYESLGWVRRDQPTLRLRLDGSKS